jgi:hypothetical protein
MKATITFWRCIYYLEVIYMKSCELVTFVTAVACNMASCYTEDELTMLSAVFTQLGDTLATILTNESMIDSAKEDLQTSSNNESGYDTDNKTDKESQKDTEKESECDS